MESTPQQTSEGKAVVAVLAAVLDRLVKSNSNNNAAGANNRTNGGNVTKFHALKAPGISIKQYLDRIHKYASCSAECFILALIYIDRLIQRNNFILSGLNVHRVVITAILLAAKFFDDAYYNNAYYAKVGGVLVSEMNGLEVEFLFRIDFSLHVTPEVFLKYQDELVSHAIGAGMETPRKANINMGDVSKLPNCPQPMQASVSVAPAPVVSVAAQAEFVDVPMTAPAAPVPSHQPRPLQAQSQPVASPGQQPWDKPQLGAGAQSHVQGGHPMNEGQHPDRAKLQSNHSFRNTRVGANTNVNAKPMMEHPFLQPPRTQRHDTYDHARLHRHITPSPPHTHHHRHGHRHGHVHQGTSSSSTTPSSMSSVTVSPAKSAPGALLVHNLTGHAHGMAHGQTQQSDLIDTGRPRHNSFPMATPTVGENGRNLGIVGLAARVASVSRPAPALAHYGMEHEPHNPHEYQHEQLHKIVHNYANNQHTHTQNSSIRMHPHQITHTHQTADVLPCNHFDFPHLSPNASSPQFVNVATARGVYQ